MAFCGNCGAQLTGDEHFCSKCGNQVATNGAATPVATARGPAGSEVYPAQMPIPVVMATSPVAQTKGKGLIWAGIIVLALLAGAYYSKHHQQTPSGPGQWTPGQAPGAQGRPGAARDPATAPNPSGAPGPAPAPGAPVEPGEPGPGGPNAALVEQQEFSNDSSPANGVVEIFNGRWTNNSSIAMQQAILECDQYDDSGDVLAQMRTTLNGPVQPGGTGAYNAFDMGAVKPGLVRVNCGIVAVSPAG
jgi:hypothetical protein